MFIHRDAAAVVAIAQAPIHVYLDVNIPAIAGQTFVPRRIESERFHDGIGVSHGRRVGHEHGCALGDVHPAQLGIILDAPPQQHLALRL
jgi:hypothetical protein